MEVSLRNQNTNDIYENINFELRVYDWLSISGVLGTIFLLSIITKVDRQRSERNWKINNVAI